MPPAKKSKPPNPTLNNATANSCNNNAKNATIGTNSTKKCKNYNFPIQNRIKLKKKSSMNKPRYSESNAPKLPSWISPPSKSSEKELSAKLDSANGIRTVNPLPSRNSKNLK